MVGAYVKTWVHSGLQINDRHYGVIAELFR